MFATAIAIVGYFESMATSATVSERPHFFATAADAALGAVYPEKSPIEIVRINVAGRYATVLMHGAFIEGQSELVPILVQRFSFGWQALDSLNFVCRLTTHGIGVKAEALLMRGMPALKGHRECRFSNEDIGPKQQVDALRRASVNPLTPSVKVVGGYAVVEWAGAGGGQALYRLGHGEWNLIQGGGGALDVDLAREHGVPQAAWCALQVAGAKCRSRRLNAGSIAFCSTREIRRT
jgi:hypothetical protein